MVGTVIYHTLEYLLSNIQTEFFDIKHCLTNRQKPQAKQWQKNQQAKNQRKNRQYGKQSYDDRDSSVS